ncbi:MAG TPA: Rrf2 family transcriptional regulator [Jatrophihabitantaceae bacterium]
MSAGVEWAVHSCLNLAWAEPDEAKTAVALAAFYDLPAAYLNKQLQALARAGILTSTPGPRGGFRLARDPSAITVLDIVTAIEGAEEAFQCTSILRNGPSGRANADYPRRCAISQAMRRADLAWRHELAGTTLDDLRQVVERQDSRVPNRTREWFTHQRR